MGKSGFKTLLIVALLGFELAREWVVLRKLGFEPDRFIEWLRGGSDA